VGIGRVGRRADDLGVIWPAAALAVFLLGFVVFYGSVLQSRLGGHAQSVTDEPETTA